MLRKVATSMQLEAKERSSSSESENASAEYEEGGFTLVGKETKAARRVKARESSADSDRSYVGEQRQYDGNRTESLQKHAELLRQGAVEELETQKKNISLKIAELHGQNVGKRKKKSRRQEDNQTSESIKQEPMPPTKVARKQRNQTYPGS